jgi:hypothetical protein
MSEKEPRGLWLSNVYARRSDVSHSFQVIQVESFWLPARPSQDRVGPPNNPAEAQIAGLASQPGLGQAFILPALRCWPTNKLT